MMLNPNTLRKVFLKSPPRGLRTRWALLSLAAMLFFLQTVAGMEDETDPPRVEEDALTVSQTVAGMEDQTGAPPNEEGALNTSQPADGGLPDADSDEPPLLPNRMTTLDGIDDGLRDSLTSLERRGVPLSRTPTATTQDGLNGSQAGDRSPRQDDPAALDDGLLGMEQDGSGFNELDAVQTPGGPHEPNDALLGMDNHSDTDFDNDDGFGPNHVGVDRQSSISTASSNFSDGTVGSQDQMEAMRAEVDAISEKLKGLDRLKQKLPREEHQRIYSSLEQAAEFINANWVAVYGGDDQQGLELMNATIDDTSNLLQANQELVPGSIIIRGNDDIKEDELSYKTFNWKNPYLNENTPVRQKIAEKVNCPQCCGEFEGIEELEPNANGKTRDRRTQKTCRGCKGTGMVAEFEEKALKKEMYQRLVEETKNLPILSQASQAKCLELLESDEDPARGQELQREIKETKSKLKAYRAELDKAKAEVIAAKYADKKQRKSKQFNHRHIAKKGQKLYKEIVKLNTSNNKALENAKHEVQAAERELRERQAELEAARMGAKEEYNSACREAKEESMRRAEERHTLNNESIEGKKTRGGKRNDLNTASIEANYALETAMVNMNNALEDIKRAEDELKAIAEKAKRNNEASQKTKEVQGQVSDIATLLGYVTEALFHKEALHDQHVGLQDSHKKLQAKVTKINLNANTGRKAKQENDRMKVNKNEALNRTRFNESSDFSDDVSSQPESSSGSRNSAQSPSISRKSSFYDPNAPPIHMPRQQSYQELEECRHCHEITVNPETGYCGDGANCGKHRDDSIVGRRLAALNCHRRLPADYASLRPSEQAIARGRLMNRPKSHIVVLEQLLEDIKLLNKRS